MTAKSVQLHPQALPPRARAPTFLPCYATALISKLHSDPLGLRFCQANDTPTPLQFRVQAPL